MRVGSLFSGVGGLDLGLERAGHRVVFQAEADPFRRRVLAARFPGVHCYADVREVASGDGPRGRRDLAAERRGGDPDAARRDPAPDLGCDLVAGGFPCQDLSVAGRRAGLAGNRSSLFFEFARVADVLVRPGGWALVENVPGLLSSHGGRDFAIVLATLAELGFHDLSWRVLDSRYLGVPQRRRRVFILARRARGRHASTVLLEPESGGGDFAPRREAGTRSASTLGSGSSSTRYNHDGDYVDALGAAVGGPDYKDAEAGRIIAPEVASALTSGSAGAGVSRPGRRQEDDWNVVANTLKSGQVKGGNYGPEHTYVPAERAAADADRDRAPAGIPGWLDRCALDPAPDGRRYAACGDAVTVPVAEWIGRRLAEYADAA